MRPINAQICGSQLRPHIVWFGEIPLQIDEIYSIAVENSLFIFSCWWYQWRVYPAAVFVILYKEIKKSTVELNLEPSNNKNLFDFAIYKLVKIAVEEFKKKLLNIVKLKWINIWLVPYYR